MPRVGRRRKLTVEHMDGGVLPVASFGGFRNGVVSLQKGGALRRARAEGP